MRKASSALPGGGTVGPLAITAGSSPGTSLITSVSTCAGDAACARRPPLIADKARRTVFISAMVAPECRSCLPRTRLSSNVKPAAGKASKEDPPPEIRAMTRSSGPSPCTACITAFAATSLRWSGTGWDASSIRTWRVGTACPSRVTTTPSSTTSGHAASNAAAMAAEALPAPTTTQRPRGLGGRCPANTRNGSALATAASNMDRNTLLARALSHTPCATGMKSSPYHPACSNTLSIWQLHAAHNRLR